MIDQRLVTDALAVLFADATGKPVGRITMPMNGNEPAPPPYYLLTPAGWVTHGAPFADTHEDATGVWQLTCVSGPQPGNPDSRGGSDQAQWLAHAARRAFLGRNPVTRQWLNTLSVPGAVCIRRGVNTDPGATNEPEDATIPYVIRFEADLTSV